MNQLLTKIHTYVCICTLSITLLSRNYCQKSAVVRVREQISVIFAECPNGSNLIHTYSLFQYWRYQDFLQHYFFIDDQYMNIFVVHNWHHQIAFKFQKHVLCCDWETCSSNFFMVVFPSNQNAVKVFTDYNSWT